MHMRRPAYRGSRCLKTYLSGYGPLTTRLLLLVAPAGLSLSLMALHYVTSVVDNKGISDGNTLPIDPTTRALMKDPHAKTMETQDDRYIKDVLNYNVSSRDIFGEKLSSQEMDILCYIKYKIGPNQVTSSGISFARNWIF